MEWYWILLIIYAFLTAILAGAGIANNCIESIPNLIDPMFIYQDNKVNIFGCFMLTLVGHILFPWYAICYWFYRLCTIGRKR